MTGSAYFQCNTVCLVKIIPPSMVYYVNLTREKMIVEMTHKLEARVNVHM